MKRGIELKCVEMQDLMEEQGLSSQSNSCLRALGFWKLISISAHNIRVHCRYPDDEIEEKVDEMRKQLLAEYEKKKKAGNKGAVKGGGTHASAEEKRRKMEAFGSALGIDASYESGTFHTNLHGFKIVESLIILRYRRGVQARLSGEKEGGTRSGERGTTARARAPSSGEGGAAAGAGGAAGTGTQPASASICRRCRWWSNS